VGAALQRGDRLVIVDNTNTMSWEIRPYIAMGAENGYVVHIQQPDTPWFFNPKELARKNTHSVPKQKIEIMLGRYEKNVTVADLMTRYKIELKPPVDPEEPDDDSCDIFQSDDEEDESGLQDVMQPTRDINPSVQRELEASVYSAEQHSPRKTLVNDASSMESEIQMGTSAASWDISPQQSWSEEHDVVSWNEDSSDPCTGFEPKPVRQPRPSRSRKQELDISSPAFEPHYKCHSDLETSDDSSSYFQGSDSTAEPTMSLSMDPMFAVQLQEAFGPPLEDSLLQFLNTNEVLTANIPYSLAHQFFSCWQDSLREYLGSKPDQKVTKESQEEDTPVAKFGLESKPEMPKTVLAPNAVDYYDKKLLEKVLKESRDLALNVKKRPLIVVKSQSADRLHQRHHEESEDDLEVYRHKRNLLYRKAMEARASNISGAAAYYAAEAREINKQFKTKQHDRQMGMFKAANDHNSQNKLDLHFLTTADAIKQLQMFIQTKVGLLRNDEMSVEIVTGKGNRSENGKSRLRPAVVNWLEQKNYRFSEINSGALKVYLKPG